MRLLLHYHSERACQRNYFLLEVPASLQFESIEFALQKTIGQDLIWCNPHNFAEAFVVGLDLAIYMYIPVYVNPTQNCYRIYDIGGKNPVLYSVWCFYDKDYTLRISWIFQIKNGNWSVLPFSRIKPWIMYHKSSNKTLQLPIYSPFCWETLCQGVCMQNEKENNDQI